MRTTLSIDPDVLSAARQLAAVQSKSLGSIISKLARKDLKSPGQAPKTRNGFPIFPVSGDAPIVTPEDVRRAEEDDEQRFLRLRPAGR